MCEYCRCIGNYHDPQCPNAMQPEPISKCSVCGEAIHSGDKIYRLSENESIHAECAKGLTPEEVLDLTSSDISVSFRNQSIDADMFLNAFDYWTTEA